MVLFLKKSSDCGGILRGEKHVCHGGPLIVRRVVGRKDACLFFFVRLSRMRGVYIYSFIFIGLIAPSYMHVLVNQIGGYYRRRRKRLLRRGLVVSLRARVPRRVLTCAKRTTTAAAESIMSKLVQGILILCRTAMEQPCTIHPKPR